MIPVELLRGVDVSINGPTLRPIWLTIFTAMFMHGGLMHLTGNMVFLLIFGNNIEDALGRVKYIAFYLLCGVIAAFAQVFANPNSIIPTLGASGAIAGALGAYLVLFPHARVNTLFFVFLIFTARIPAWVLLGFWIVSQFFSQYTEALKVGAAHGKSGGVAYLAHIGGFIAGMILIKLFRAKPPKPGDSDGFTPWYQDPRYNRRYKSVVVENRFRP
jgi:membrane associated rhomboid family serine protease